MALFSRFYGTRIEVEVMGILGCSFILFFSPPTTKSMVIREESFDDESPPISHGATWQDVVAIPFKD